MRNDKEKKQYNIYCNNRGAGGGVGCNVVLYYKSFEPALDGMVMNRSYSDPLLSIEGDCSDNNNCPNDPTTEKRIKSDIIWVINKEFLCAEL